MNFLFNKQEYVFPSLDFSVLNWKDRSYYISQSYCYLANFYRFLPHEQLVSCFVHFSCLLIPSFEYFYKNLQFQPPTAPSLPLSFFLKTQQSGVNIPSFVRIGIVYPPRKFIEFPDDLSCLDSNFLSDVNILSKYNGNNVFVDNYINQYKYRIVPKIEVKSIVNFLFPGFTSSDSPSLSSVNNTSFCASPYSSFPALFSHPPQSKVNKPHSLFIQPTSDDLPVSFPSNPHLIHPSPHEINVNKYP
jgi:hypothetical protein